MNIVNFLTSNVLVACYSKYNGEIKVIEQFGQRKIYAGGLLQSGSIIKELWQKPISQIKYQKVNNVLILGFGGGTVTQMLLKKYPQAQITGIEIDPIMIEIYQKYFSNHAGNNDPCSLQLINADCFHWINKCIYKYDLILIDLYQGHDIPQNLYQIKFIKDLKKCLNPNGSVLINHLFFDKYKEKVPDIIKILESEFSQIKLVRSLSNLFLIIKNG